LDGGSPSEVEEDEAGTVSASDSQLRKGRKKGSDTHVADALAAARDEVLSDPEMQEDLKRWNPTEGDPAPTVPDFDEVMDAPQEEKKEEAGHTNDHTSAAAGVPPVADPEKVCVECGGMKLLIDGKRRCVKCGAS
jgi:hypothetical protein